MQRFRKIFNVSARARFLRSAGSMKNIGKIFGVLFAETKKMFVNLQSKTKKRKHYARIE